MFRFKLVLIFHFLSVCVVSAVASGVHRCGTSSSVYACHTAGPGSIPSRDKFPGRGFLGVFPHL